MIRCVGFLFPLLLLGGCATPPIEPAPPIAVTGKPSPAYRPAVAWQAGGSAGAARRGEGYIHVLQPRAAGDTIRVR